MTQAERIRKMQAVLDGEATPEETREIEALVARDVQARAEHEQLQRLFAALRDLPQAHAPEGLVAAATRLYDHRNQLSTSNGVIEDNSIADPGLFPGRSVRRPPSHGEPRKHGGVTMSDRTGNRKLWIG